MSYSREITTFPLNPVVMGKLLRAGLNTVACFSSLNPTSLNLSTGLSLQEAEQVLKILFQDGQSTSENSESFSIKSALNLLQEEQEQEPIVTFCEAVDSMLGGGVPLGKVVEFCGAPGTGKTQFCLQLAVDARIPESFGGVGGETVYIDTEGSLVVGRLAEIARSAVAHCSQVAVSQGIHDQNHDEFTMERIMRGIHCYRCHDYYELMATIELLPELLKSNKKVKLVVVDSLASPFRHNLEDMNLRRLLLAILTQNFLRLAAEFKVAVVLTNQMTTKIMPREDDSHQIPALGDTWAHVPAARVVLSTDYHGDRVASLIQSSNRKETQCPFQVTDHGIRDAPSTSTQAKQPP